MLGVYESYCIGDLLFMLGTSNPKYFAEKLNKQIPRTEHRNDGKGMNIRKF